MGITRNDEPPATTPLRDRVSILCTRLAVGQTFADPLLAPAAADLSNDWLAAAMGLVQAHGGRVLKTADPGAAVAAVVRAAYARETKIAPDTTVPLAERWLTFAAEFVQADHAERALRCGLALLDAAHAHAAAARHFGLQPGGALCVGVHTGPPEPPAGSDQAPSPTAHIAACINRAAPPGRLRASVDSVAHVRGQFDVEPVMPLVVGDLGDTVQTCLLRPTTPGSLEDVAPVSDLMRPPMVGREAELRALNMAFRCLVDTARAAAVTVLADAGCGKTRLLREFDGWLQAQPQALHILRGQALPHTQGQPFGLLAGLLRSYCQIAPDATGQAACTQLEQAIVPWFLAEDGADLAESNAHTLGQLIGIDFSDSRHLRGIVSDPRQLRDLAFNAASQWLRRMSAGGRAPVIVLIEDLHWADSETLDFLDHLLQVNRDTALLIVACARPALEARRPAWAGHEGLHQRIDLGRLDAAGQRRLASALLKKLPVITPGLIHRVVDGAQGHPFCIEERVNLLIDQGVIVASGDEWTVSASRLRTAALPATLDEVLKARLDLLPAAERRTLQRASVIGPAFGAEALQSMGRGMSQTMPALLQRELAMTVSVAEQGGSPSFNFKHQLLQGVVYASLPAGTRRALHARFAAWLVGISGRRGIEVLGQSAHHFEQAGDVEHAAEQHARAAEVAHQRYASEAVMDHVQRGLALLDRLPAVRAHRELRWRLLKARIRMLEIIGQRVQHRVDLEALLALADELADDTRRADAHLGFSILAMFTADYAAMKLSARQAMGRAARAGHHTFRLQAMRQLAMANFRLGDWDAGQRLAHQCLAEARERGLREVEAFCTNTLGVIASRQRDPVASLQWAEQTLAAWRDLGDRGQETINICNIGDSWLELGEMSTARRHLEEGARLARACGNLIAYSAALGNLSVLERWLGNGEGAVSLAGLAVDAAVAASAPDFEVLAMQQLGEAELSIGHHAAAARAFGAIQALAQRHQLPEQPDALAGLAAVALAQDDVPTALQPVLRVLELDARGAVAVVSMYPRRLALVCHRVLSSAGDPRALAWLARAHDELMSMAVTISDEPLREGFLNNIPDHRAILAAWAVAEDETKQARHSGTL